MFGRSSHTIKCVYGAGLVAAALLGMASCDVGGFLSLNREDGSGAGGFGISTSSGSAGGLGSLTNSSSESASNSSSASGSLNTSGSGSASGSGEGGGGPTSSGQGGGGSTPSCSDQDCGAVCPNRCKEGQTCKDNGDCTLGVCVDADGGRICDASECFNGTRDRDETSVDCGGQCAKICNNGNSCTTTEECPGGVCAHGLCLLGLGRHCGDDAECASGLCKQDAGHVCAKCSQDGDCPSGSCQPDGYCAFPDGYPCVEGEACVHKQCTNNLCLLPNTGTNVCSELKECASHVCSSGHCSACTMDMHCNPYNDKSTCIDGNCSLSVDSYCSLAAGAPQCPATAPCTGFPLRCTTPPKP